MLFSNESKPRQPSIDMNTSDNIHLVNFGDLADTNTFNEQLWNTSSSENNSCAKACVNVNMGYNEGVCDIKILLH